jgi:uroporphyrinogen decarboxylase
VKNDLFLRACRGEAVERTPVWMMRQAGRYLPEYQELRRKHTFWEMCTIPELTTEVTLQPIRRLGVDAAILFSDILVPLAAMGMEVQFHPAPEIPEPVRSASDIDRLASGEESSITDRVTDAVRMLRRELDGTVPLIGFAGAPFTLAAYAVCGGGSRNQAELRAMLFSDPALVHRLLRKLTDAIVHSLRRQIEAGAQAVQLFDSWAGVLSREDYESFALPYARETLERAAVAGVPTVYFAPGGSTHLERIAEAGADMIGVDWRIPLARAREILGDRFAVQGNLDPGILLGNIETIEARTRAILEEARAPRAT